ncbi:MAG: 2Fe-2S iron-sulfur cluster-binding protein [Elusimicrobiales bacterium]
MPEITINGKKYVAKEGETILQVADRNSIYIPRFCYHPALSIAGNCRMCLVEIEKNPKLQIACATPVVDGMVVWTESEKVKKARKDVLEFLLLNHPLDCPICDQVGECYLQDYYMEYGLKKSRIRYEDKNTKMKRRDIGKYIILDNERCILCTRCIRFLEEITKTKELFINSRGDHSFIDIKPGLSIDNNYSLNLADICPVGAITSKDFRFKKRVYMLSTKKSVCLECATGCRILVQYDENENKIYRVLPDPNIHTNIWICDIGRLSYKKLYDEKRITISKIDGKEVELKEAFTRYAKFFSRMIEERKKVCVILSNYLSLEDNIALIKLAKKLFETDMVFFTKGNEKRIDDGILLNTDKSPNSTGIEMIKGYFNIKEYNFENADFFIGYEKEIFLFNHHIDPSRAILFSFYNHSNYPNQIAIKSYLEAEGSFVNWQGYAFKTPKIVVAPKNSVGIYEFIKKIMELNGFYIEDIKELQKFIYEKFKFKTEL